MLSSLSQRDLGRIQRPVGPEVRTLSTQQHRAPFNVAIIYNQSPHAVKSVVDELRSEWGRSIKIIQVTDGARQPLPNVDATIQISKGKWNDLDHFKERLNAFKSSNPAYRKDIEGNKAAFSAVWSGFAEAGDTGRKVQEMGLIWTGTTPSISDKLEKMGFKEICDTVGAPTPSWFQLPDAGNTEESIRLIQERCESGAWMVKSIHGGGGVGTKSFDDARNISDVSSALERVVSETKSSDGIYVEQKVNVQGGFFQLEIELDGTTVAHGTRVVWFNADNAKVLEIGCQDQYVETFGIPLHLIQDVKEKAKRIGVHSKNNTRGTIEALIYKDATGHWKSTFIEMNRRPQVENEALSYLEQDAITGERRKTFVESFKRACGVPVPKHVPSKVPWVAHLRLLVGDPNRQGRITNHLGTIKGFSGQLPPGIQAYSICEGDISVTSNPQHGRIVITAPTLSELCDRIADGYRYLKPNVPGVESTYGETMARIVETNAFKTGQIASNQTFDRVELPKRDFPNQTIDDALLAVAKIMVNGYRPGEGIDPDRFPTSKQISEIVDLERQLQDAPAPVETPFSRFSRGDVSYDEYIDQIKGQLMDLGGGWNTVAPRDTRQQAGDSESFVLMQLSARIAEQHYALTGAIDFEGGGAQYQAGIIRGFNPFAILTLGLTSNMMTSALIRSQWLNGLTELPPDIRALYYNAFACGVRHHYGLPNEATVPMTLNNFHAGNYYGPQGSPQDETTEQILKSGLNARPNWVFSSKFSLKQLEEWVYRQIDLFERNGRQLRELRIKNPGQGLDYSADALWSHIQVIKTVFENRGLESPIVFIHNHDFNGASSHELVTLLRRGQSHGYPFIVVDAAYRKSGTHPDNTIIASALDLSPVQRDHLEEGNRRQQLVESLTTRFDSKESQMTPWDSDWAGGTEGSDLRIAKEYGLSPSDIEKAKRISNEVFKIERAVTPFSEYKLRLGIAIMIEDGILEKTPEAVVKHIQSGGKLKVGGDVLLGLSHWQSLIKKPEIVDTLLNNMSDELAAALESSKSPLRPSEKASELETFVTAGFQQKGMEWLSGTIPDLSPLLTAPHVLHAKPRELPPNTPFSLQLATGKNESVLFMGSSISRDQSTVSLEFMVNNQIKQISLPNPNAMTGIADEGPKLAKDPNEYGLPVPGEVVSLNIETGTVLESGQPLATVESMKMQMQLTVPEEFDGHIVDKIYPKIRSASDQGSILPKNGLFFSVRRSLSTTATHQALRSPMTKPLVTHPIVPDVYLTTMTGLKRSLRTTRKPFAALGLGAFAVGATFFSGK